MRKLAKFEREDQMDTETIQWKKDYAVILKASDLSYRKISDVVGVTTSMVKRWFEDDKLKARVEDVRTDMTKGAVDLMKASSVEAVHIIMASARGALAQQSWKDALAASTEVLDRTGVTKVNKSEALVTKTERHEHELSEDFFSKLEALPLETQKRIAELTTELDTIVSEASGNE